MVIIYPLDQSLINLFKNLFLIQILIIYFIDLDNNEMICVSYFYDLLEYYLNIIQLALSI